MIGSGAVESSNRRIVTQRLEQSGMFWSQRGAQAIISLRAYFLSNFSRCRTSGVLCDKITELSLLILINSVKYIQGLLSSLIAYPIAERQEKRYILRKRAELHTYYKLSFDQRKQVASAKLADMIEYAGHAIPYYRDLFHAQAFDPSKLRQDIRYLTDIPFLTKEIIREQGTRLLSHPLQEIRHHVRPTGGSTGLSCQLYYDQEALDYSAAITLYARETAEKKCICSSYTLQVASPMYSLAERERGNFIRYSHSLWSGRY